MARITEWVINHALHVFFRHSSEYFLIFQDPDLHIYADRCLIPLKRAREGIPATKRVARASAVTHRGKPITVDPQQFRPDAVMLGRNGHVHIVETKIGRLNAKAECLSLVMQALVYADLVISPRWKPPGRRMHNVRNATHDLLEDLHEAHWFIKEFNEGKYRRMETRHQRHFRLSRALSGTSFDHVPSVIFLLEDINEEHLADACAQVRNLPFPAFKTYAEQGLRKRDAFRKHIRDLENNWPKLQTIAFSRMYVHPDIFQAVIGESVVALS